METDRLMDMEMDKSVSAGPWRSLSAAEIEALEAGGNSCRDWSLLRVSGQEFRPERVRGCRFSGTVRIGRIPDSSLEYGSLRLPAGIYGSYIDSCDIGDGCAVHNVGMLGRYVVCRGSMLFNVRQMTASPDAALFRGYSRFAACSHDSAESAPADAAGPFSERWSCPAYECQT